MRVRFIKGGVHMAYAGFTPAHAGKILTKPYEQYTLDLLTVQIL